jgi:hypothetical protein
MIIDPGTGKQIIVDEQIVNSIRRRSKMHLSLALSFLVIMTHDIIIFGWESEYMGNRVVYGLVYLFLTMVLCLNTIIYAMKNMEKDVIYMRQHPNRT